jgi:hypothetical protein
MSNLTFDMEDLQLNDIQVTSMSDAVALPETGASSLWTCVTSCSCCLVEE